MTESWLVTDDECLDGAHDFSVVREVAKEDLPRFVQGPVSDTYCALCGVKQTMRHRVAAAVTAGTISALPAYVPPPAPPKSSDVMPDPLPLDEVHVELNIEKYGKRYDNDRKRGVVDKAIMIEGDPRWTDAMAAAAEEYIGKALGLVHAGDVDKPDKGYDLLMPSGRRVQVKWTRSHANKLISSPKQTNAADYYVLVTGASTDDFQVQGWATLAELKASTQNLGYGETYCVEQGDLRPFETLLAIRLDTL